MKWVGLILAGWVGLAAAQAQAPAVDGPQLTAARGNAGKRLAEVAARLDKGEAAAAADDLRRLLAEAGTNLVSTDGTHFQPVRVAAQAVQARLPAVELRAYRDRADAPAAELLARGLRDRDPVPLRRVVNEYFATTAAEEAFSLLGDLAFERGEFHAAETYWQRLLPSAEFPPRVLLPTQDAARTRARIALAVLFQGDLDRFQRLLAEYQAAHAAATGSLAGRDGNYLATLESVRAQRPEVPAAASTDGAWPAFAGNPARTGHTVVPMPAQFPAQPTWKVRVPGGGSVDPMNLRGGSARRLARHPVVLDTTGYVADATGLFGFDVRTGNAVVRYRHVLVDPPPPEASADYPLSVVPSRRLLLARMGPAVVSPPPPRSGSVLAAFTVARGGELSPAFTLTPPVPDGVPAAWEAAPTWANGRLYAAFVREANSRLTTALACYPDTGGEPLWVTDLTDAPVTGRPERYRPEPVSVGGGRAVFVTHAGFVVAVDAHSGQPAWAVAVPPAERPTPHPRDLCPAILDGGRVFVAPTDADRVLALDAVTGRTLWQVTGTQTGHFLGIAAGNLVAAVAAPVRGLRAYRVTTGDSQEPAGWRVHDDTFLTDYGRGLVAENAVVWPTRSAVFFARPTDGLPLPARLLGPHGNLAYADGTLLVATPNEVWGYVRSPAPSSPPRPPRGPDAIVASVLACAPGGGVPAREAFLARHPLTPADRQAFVARPSGVPVRLNSFLDEFFQVPTRSVPAPNFNQPIAVDSPPPVPLGPSLVAETLPLPTPTCRGLEPFENWQILTGPDPALYVADERAVFALPTGAGPPRWRTPLPARFTATHVQAVGSRVLIAGPQGVIALDRITGSTEWTAVLPASTPPLNGFQAVEASIVCRAGAFHRLAFDLATGEVKWGRDGRGQSRLADVFPGTPPLAPFLAALPGHILTQPGPDRHALLNLASGETEFVSVPPAEWRGPPAALMPDALAVPAGPQEVRRVMLDSRGGLRTTWTWTAPGPTSLTGRAPRIQMSPVGLFVAVDRNTTTELELLDPARGRSTWLAARPLPAGDCDLAAMAVAPDAAYLPIDDNLHALRLGDGRAAWAEPVNLAALLAVAPGQRYHVAAGPRGVVVVPCGLEWADDTPRLARVLGALPLPSRAVAVAVAQLDAWFTRRLPVVVLDPTTGQPTGRLDLPAGPAALVHLAGPNPVVVTAGTVSWLK